MRGTLKVIRTATILVATVGWMVGCAEHVRTSRGPTSDLTKRVAKQDAMPGYTPEECYYVDEEAQSGADQAGGGVSPNMGGVSVNKGGARRRVVCHHKEEIIAPKAATSGEPQAICSAHDGLLRLCDENWS